jgi:hypothetical protein
MLPGCLSAMIDILCAGRQRYLPPDIIDVCVCVRARDNIMRDFSTYKK